MTTADQSHTGGDAAADRIRQAGQDAASDVTAQARAQLDRGRSTAADTVASTSEVLDHTADDLRAHGQETLAQATTALAGQLSTLARRLEQSSVEELTRDARELARRNPGLFVAGGVAIGLALGRFFRASSPSATSTTGTPMDSYATGSAGSNASTSSPGASGPAYGGEGALPGQGSSANRMSPAGGSYPVGGSSMAGASSATDPASTSTSPSSPSNSGNQGGKQ